ncbi:MAG: bifunctional methionine sulfoxide reductase B/A protein [Planctomycetota bacterium]|nr:bifunctional methionine sulfoxide reductase B/A protein [Planctomycetota bacterium]
MVRLRVYGADGKLSPARDMPKVELSDAEWKKRLTPEQFRITRGKGTEQAFCGGLLNNKGEGVYVCVDCNLPLYRSNAKFESGTGWPSFYEPVAKENVHEEADRTYGMVRTEILCARCDAHLGHVFDDGPPPTGMRHCLNSESLKFVPNEQLASIAEPAGAATAPATKPAATAPATKPSAASPRTGSAQAEVVFAGGCFWCVEAVFEELEGVKEVVSGYAGGSAATANYEAVCTGDTGHAEAVKIVYDPNKVSYEQLLKVHFATHDPTSLNRQGNDAGTQYRSAIFYANDQERQLAAAFIADVTASKAFNKPIVTTLEPLKQFFPAEAYHQNFVCRNPNQGYVRAIALPKVEKVREKFKAMIKVGGENRAP